MIILRLSPRAFADVDRFTSSTLEHDPGAADGVLESILNGLEVLRRHPLIGRPVEHGLRELVISRGRSGYIALYEFNPTRGEILVHKLRHQLEAGYRQS